VSQEFATAFSTMDLAAIDAVIARSAAAFEGLSC
jgi:hypothetical protein